MRLRASLSLDPLPHRSLCRPAASADVVVSLVVHDYGLAYARREISKGYYRFFDTYGTHYIIQSILGGEYGVQHKYSEESYEEAVNNGVDIEASISANKGPVNAEVGGSSSTSDGTTTSNSLKAENTHRWTKGVEPVDDFDSFVKTGVITPEPVKLILEPITTLFGSHQYHQWERWYRHYAQETTSDFPRADAMRHASFRKQFKLTFPQNHQGAPNSDPDALLNALKRELPKYCKAAVGEAQKNLCDALEPDAPLYQITIEKKYGEWSAAFNELCLGFRNNRPTTTDHNEGYWDQFEKICSDKTTANTFEDSANDLIDKMYAVQPSVNKVEWNEIRGVISENLHKDVRMRLKEVTGKLQDIHPEHDNKDEWGYLRECASKAYSMMARLQMIG